MRSVMQLLEEANGTEFGVKPSDELKYVHSCKRPHNIQPKPEPEFTDASRPFGSASPAMKIRTRYDPMSPSVQTDYLYRPQLVLPNRSVSIREKVELPQEKDRSPPVGRYNVEEAFNKLKSARSALISNFEEVQHNERRPLAYYYPEYVAKRKPCQTMKSDREILLYDPEQVRFPSPMTYSSAKERHPKLSKLEKNLVEDDKCGLDAAAARSMHLAARMLSPEYIKTGIL